MPDEGDHVDITGKRSKRARIVESYLAHASDADREELIRILSKKRQTAGGIEGLARSTARQIQRQIGINDKMIQRSTRDIVGRLIAQHEPHLSGQRVNQLTDWILSSTKKKYPDGPLLRSMIHYFVEYSLGRMSSEDYHAMPKDWTKAYWDRFPDPIRKAIRSLVHQRITEAEFRHRIAPYTDDL